MTSSSHFYRFCTGLALLGFLAFPAPSRAQSAAEWRDIQAKAEAFVAKESPPAAWPFERPRAAVLSASEKKVFPHYFLPFPLSMDNKAAAEDTYARLHLSPEGSDKYLAGRGGYKVGGGGVLRQRPLPAGPWSSLYWKQINFAIDILRARAMGADGFGVDLLAINSGRLWEDLLALMDTAEAVAPGFGIMLEPDMSALKKKSSPEELVEALATLAKRSSAYRLADGRLVVTPFSAQTNPPEYWKEVFGSLAERGVPTAFWPIFLGFESLPKYGEAYGPMSYGFSDWGLRDLRFAEELHFASAKAQAAPFAARWMMPVAPQDVRAKGLTAWEPENTKMFRALWDAAIAGGSDWVHLITWNDYSEASEVSPSSCTQYVYYDLAAYYTAWFKTGEAPKIVRDAIYYCHRSQLFPMPEKPPKQRDHFRQAGKTPFVNDVEMVAMLTAPGTLEIEQNGKTERREARAGLTAFRVPAQAGRPVFRVVRGGKPVAEIHSGWEIATAGDVENPVYCGGSSTRPFVDAGAAPAQP